MSVTSTDSAVHSSVRPEVLQTMGDATLKKLATELTEKLRNSTTVDWQVRDAVRAKMRILIRQLLRKYKYPPEGQEAAIALVLQQAEVLAEEWSSEGAKEQGQERKRVAA